MKSYRGYFIDNIVFDSKEEVDRFIKHSLVSQLKKLGRMFVKESDPESLMVISNRMSEIAKQLHDDCGMSWDAIEEVEFA